MNHAKSVNAVVLCNMIVHVHMVGFQILKLAWYTFFQKCWGQR